MLYDIVTIRDSKLACSALYLALRMKEMIGWTSTLEFYTGKGFIIEYFRKFGPDSVIFKFKKYDKI